MMSTGKKIPDPVDPNSPLGVLDRMPKKDKSEQAVSGPASAQAKTEPSGDVFAPFPEGKNPRTGEIGGPSGPEPTRFGDWERKGRVSDF